VIVAGAGANVGGWIGSMAHDRLVFLTWLFAVVVFKALG
jgi:hypothetical protein